MANKRMTLSEEGKVLLDNLTEQLDFERVFVIHLALAKGLQISNGIPREMIHKGSKKWTIPDNIIKENHFTLFKYLIQNEAQEPLDNEQLHST